MHHRAETPADCCLQLHHGRSAQAFASIFRIQQRPSSFDSKAHLEQLPNERAEMPAIRLGTACAFNKIVEDRGSDRELVLRLEGQVDTIRQVLRHTLQGWWKHLAGWRLRAKAAEQAPLVRRRRVSAAGNGHPVVTEEGHQAAAARC